MLNFLFSTLFSLVTGKTGWTTEQKRKDLAKVLAEGGQYPGYKWRIEIETVKENNYPLQKVIPGYGDSSSNDGCT